MMKAKVLLGFPLLVPYFIVQTCTDLRPPRMGGCKLGPLQSCFKSQVASPVAGTFPSRNGQSKQLQAVLNFRQVKLSCLRSVLIPEGEEMLHMGRKKTNPHTNTVTDEWRIYFITEESTQALPNLKMATLINK